VFTDRLVESKSYEVKAGTVQASLTVGKDWGTGAYVVATLRRPLDVPAGHMPGRAIGVKWFSIDRSAHELPVTMRLPAAIRPNSTLTVPLHFAGLKPGDEARVVVAAVDVGILNLTNYKPPAPDDYYLGQRRLSADIRDFYGELIDGMQGALGPIRSGGGAEAELTGSPPTQKPLALYSGIVKVAADGSAQVKFAIPAFAGTVRVMAVASARPWVTLWCATRWCSPRRCRVSCATATAAPCNCRSIMWKAPPAITASPCVRKARSNSPITNKRCSLPPNSARKCRYR
jgi:uncharacterized protein YfaS (alpha-2-macroglobulin family)